jgi:hypothetical protein
MVVLLSFATINCTSDLTLISTDTESYQWDNMYVRLVPWILPNEMLNNL